MKKNHEEMNIANNPLYHDTINTIYSILEIFK